jgi:hypothetical protein
LERHYVRPKREAELGDYRMVLGMLMLSIGFQRLGHIAYVRTDAIVCGVLRAKAWAQCAHEGAFLAAA